MRISRHILLWLLPMLCPLVAYASAFVPMAQSYQPRDYHAANQNWSVSQTPDGVICVANTNGVLLFDGAEWQQVALPDMRMVRSVMATSDGRIYVGSFEELGYFEKDNTGRYIYHSFRDILREQLQSNDEFWSIVELDGNIVFHSFRSVAVFDGVNVRTHRFDENIPMLTVCDGNLYVNFQFRGLARVNLADFNYTMCGGGLRDVVALLPYGDGEMLAVTKLNGLSIISPRGVRPLRSNADSELRRAEINRAVMTRDSLYALGTISEGVIIIDRVGKIKAHLTAENGQLSNNTVLGLFNDAENNVWCALDNGVSVFSPTSSMRKIVNIVPDVGTIYSVARQQNNLYIASNQGLYRTSLTQGGAVLRAQKILSGQVWELFPVGRDLICSNTGNTRLLRNGEMSEINYQQGGVNVADGRVGGHDILIQSTYSSLCVYTKDDKGGWQFRNEVEGFINPIRYVAIDYKGRIWASHFRRGLYCVELSEDLRRADNVTFIPSPDKSSALFNVFSVAGGVVFANKERMYTFDEATGSIKPYERLNNVLGRFRTAYRIVHFADDRYWFITTTHAALVRMNNREIALIDVVPYRAFSEDYIDDQQNIVTLSADSSLFCFENSLGLYVYDSGDAHIESEPDFKVTIKSISAFSDKGDVRAVPLEGRIDIPYEYRNMVISFSKPSFARGNEVYYRWRFDERDSQWSEPTTVTHVNLPALKSGEYDFEVQSLSESGGVDSVAKVQFRVRPNKYLSGVAWCIYAVLFTLLIMGITRYVMSVVARDKRKIIEQEAESRRKRLSEHQQVVMRLEKDKLEREVGFKSKELASSTMSIIRKNEILMQIKRELTEQKEQLGSHYPAKYYDRIMRLIDQNISSDDDWAIFQTNFDRIHENFFRNLKQRYTLTEADLRLCAFLRLNLTTKEIASLLNISIKGVEVARYRLRKKLTLPTEQSLTEFLIMFR